jgi:type I restriction enzyme, S subunit
LISPELFESRPWLGEIPAHWRNVRLRWLIQDIEQGWSPEAEDREPVEGEWGVLKLNAVHRGTFNTAAVKVLPAGLEAPANLQVQSGDLLITRANTPGQVGDVCFVAKARPRVILSDLIYRLRLREDRIDGRYLSFFLLSSMSRRQIESDARGTSNSMVKISREHIKSWRIPVPPLAQQRVIAEYLESETARLDAMVAAKERVLELLAEKRRALITRAVTRGLDPNIPLRDSGIPWVGEIPMHWQLIPCRFLVDMVGGATPDTGNAEFWDGDIPWVSPKDMKRDEIEDAEDHVTQLALSSSALRLIEPPAVLIVVRGMILAHSFPTAVTTRPITINQDMKALHCCEFLEPRFLRDFLRGLGACLVAMTEESAHGTRKLESEVLGRLAVCVPPLKEQGRIIAYIAAETAKLDALRVATERTIVLLKERRDGLIAAAVTGNILVPEAG